MYKNDHPVISTSEQRDAELLHPQSQIANNGTRPSPRKARRVPASGSGVMRDIIFFPPARMKATGKKVATILEGFDWTKLPHAETFKHDGRGRRHMKVEMSELDYRSLSDHCDFYGKSFSTAIMQALVIAGVWKR